MKPIILLVDDSLMIHRVVGQILTEAGFKVLKAYNGKKGYDMAKTWKPDLIIMDIEMPEMNSIESTTLIKSDPITSTIPTIIFTSLGSEDDIKLAYKTGAKGFLNKPVSKDDLLKTVQELLDKKGYSSTNA
ncbi:response regulator [Dissulfurispira thermophila]|uniref:Response regulator n=1 Tax=Dissulfurispira thermophila TaxID=2715679 RepID=A0A7G1H0Q2_9BACT|nr:response regulator [Dissulfurispira thermophila]BCB95247.1 response regulator [Dissulfurispira thermophila]